MTGLQHGVATVTTSGPLTDKLLKKYGARALLLAPVSDLDAFVRLVLHVVAAAGERQRMGTNAQALYDDCFAFRSAAEILTNALASHAT
jgi:hypothetical protein